MSASQQHHINALLQEQLQLLTQKCEFLANAHNETLERLRKLEAANESAARSSIPARRLSTATETTIRRSSHEQLSNLVVRLCNRDDAAQKLAVSTLVGGEAISQQMPAPPTGANISLPGPSKRRASRAFSGSMKTCKNCKERFNPDEMRREDSDECWFHPGRREVDEDADFWDNEPYTDWQGRRMSGFVPFEEGMGMAWTCCGKDGRADGCERGEHEAVEAGSVSATRKRLRW